MSDTKEALKIALEALKTSDPGESGGFTYEGTYPSYDKRSVENAIAAIEAVLSHPPVSVNVESERISFDDWLIGEYGTTVDAATEARMREAWNAALPAAVQVPQWISVEERMPEDRQDVLFVVDCKNPHYDHLHGRVLGGKYIAGPPGYFSVPGLGVNASCWMPSPAAPSPTSKNGGSK